MEKGSDDTEDSISCGDDEWVLLSLGSNLGDKVGYLRSAVAQLALMGVNAKSISSIYHTPPWGKIDQPAFVNIGLLASTPLAAEELLRTCQMVESILGRSRQEHWGPRTIDIDIIYYGNHILNTDSLQIPHPYRTERSFVMIPLCEIAPDWIDPVNLQTIGTLSEQWRHSIPPLITEPWQ
jgi:2-amino-4-hydroxy-6-hydroxymethyldihydropteridine diphosphokinase